MFINFYYQFYKKPNVSASDHFSDLLGRIPPEYKYNKHRIKTVAVVLDNKLSEKVLTRVEKDGKTYAVLVTQQISFQVNGEDRMAVADQLRDVCSDATYWEISDKGFLNEVQ